MNNTLSKILLGILIGIILAFCVSFFYRTYWLRDFILKPVYIPKSDSLNQTISGAVVQFKIENAKFQENFESINKRLDDFLVFGGMIITLLLAITVSVYLKTEAEVSKHFKENFGTYNEEALRLLEDIKKTTASASQELTLLQQERKNMQSTKIPNK